jgi:putative DNA primase/helicase
MTAAEIAKRLCAKRSKSGSWMAKCPAHDDRTPSLSITDTDGRVLVHCYAGCGQNDVIAALTALGLWTDPQQLEVSTKPVVVSAYDYTDAAGNLLYQVVRTEPKGFFQRIPNGAGRWINRGPKAETKVLYHLPELLGSPIIFLPEGERDVESLRSHGFTASCEAGGASSPWLPQYTEALRGREVDIIPDNDAVGWERATRIARALLGSAARIRIMNLPASAKDVTDWFSFGHSECELIVMMEGAHAV